MDMAPVMLSSGQNRVGRCEGIPASNDPLIGRDQRCRCSIEISAIDELIEHEFADVYLLIDHLSGRADRRIGTVELEGCPEPGKKANLIDQVCQVRWPPNLGQPRDSAQVAILFKARDKLNELAAPANRADHRLHAARCPREVWKGRACA
jgi:hypothetical protein